MVDPTARDGVAVAIEAYLSGEINNDEMERRFSACSMNDRACFRTVGGMLWFSSEFKKHFNGGVYRLADRHSAMIQRWVLLLRSREEWPEPLADPPRGLVRRISSILARFRQPDLPPFAENEFWPFASMEQWQKLVRSGQLQADSSHSRGLGRGNVQ